MPYAEYEEVFRIASAAGDGQYKVQLYMQKEGFDFYVPKVGRFNVEPNIGWRALDVLVGRQATKPLPEVSHPQVQTLLGAIGYAKGFDVWIPRNDRDKLDWSLTRRYTLRDSLPERFDSILHVLGEVDVVWAPKGGSAIGALFEVEHSTPIYSGLLRFNDVYLTEPRADSRFTIVARGELRGRFITQLNRPTFCASGLVERCSFLEYADVLDWHARIIG